MEETAGTVDRRSMCLDAMGIWIGAGGLDNNNRAIVAIRICIDAAINPYSCRRCAALCIPNDLNEWHSHGNRRKCTKTELHLHSGRMFCRNAVMV